MFTTHDGEPPQPTGGLGDRAAGSIMAGAVCAALLGAQRTGAGAYITTSLVNTGLWLVASDLSDAVRSPGRLRSAGRLSAPIPTLNSFRTSDGRWLWLQVMLPAQEWPRLVAALDAPWLDEDPRFRGGDPDQLASARNIVVETLDEIFRRRPLAEWGQRLTAHGLAWAPVRTLAEVAADPELRRSSAFIEVVDRQGAKHLAINTPCTFDGRPAAIGTTSPTVGEHSGEILQQLGYDAAQVAHLEDLGVVRRPPPVVSDQRAEHDATEPSLL
jgi:crotonobetainyl-CoA:carnitine CoA-transferase CaiB-like acyl-CoA transferase